ncbi:hypothetical protein GDO86_015356 [Hymenochirus boettgeri]|nr:hypothetical protein GDO86_015356 [Hymenochirus boettgeri]
MKASSILNGKRHSHGMNYPLYMMQWYQNLISGSSKDHSFMGDSVLQESDTVLSLIAKDCAKEGNQWTLSFDMSSVSVSLELTLAELRIHVPSFEQFENITLDIYHSKGNLEKLFLGSVTTDFPFTQGSSWKVINLTDMLQYYIYQREIFTNDDYLKAQKVQKSSCNGPLAERVVLVVFSKDKPSTKMSGSSSLLETAESSKYINTDTAFKATGARRQRRNGHSQHTIMRSNIQSRNADYGKPLCRRVDMIVDFEKIGWGDQILYPKRFNAYRCEGSCPTPLNESFKPTNYAYIKSLVNVFDPEKVECPFCAPVKMSPLSMLMYEGDKIVLKHHEDMIVEDCGCQ